MVRLASSAVLAAAALAAAWLGGIVFAVFWAAAALVVAWEWTRLVAHADKRAHWLVAGGLYAAVTLIAPLMLRAEPDHGLTAVLFLFAVVWTTDAMGYVVGRALGGGSTPSCIQAVRACRSARTVQVCGLGLGCCWQAPNGACWGSGSAAAPCCVDVMM